MAEGTAKGLHRGKINTTYDLLTGREKNDLQISSLRNSCWLLPFNEMHRTKEGWKVL